MGAAVARRCLALAAVAPLLSWRDLNSTGPSFAFAEPCPGSEHEAVVQLTAERCGSCCFKLEDFVHDREYVYVLFYRKRGRLNQDLVAKFEQTAEEWRWSRVFFGKIDTDIDKLSAEKYIKPGMVPTNIIFRRGQGVEVAIADLELLKNRYQAGPVGQRWWLTKYLGDDEVGTNLHYVTPARTAAALQLLGLSPPLAARANERTGAIASSAAPLGEQVVLLVGFFQEDQDDEDDSEHFAPGSSWDVFHRFAWRAHQPEGVSAGSKAGVKGVWRASAAGVRFVAATKQAAPKGAIAAPSVAIMVGGNVEVSIPLGGKKRPKATVESLAEWALQHTQRHPAGGSNSEL